MCGIYLYLSSRSVDENEQEEEEEEPSKNVVFDINMFPDWLQRRGPDALGSVSMSFSDLTLDVDDVDSQYRNHIINHNHNHNTTTTTRHEPNKIVNTMITTRHNTFTTTVVTVNLQASVLRMRSTLVPQPLLVRRIRSTSEEEEKKTYSNDSTKPALSSLPLSSSPCCYLAWNGEVYPSCVRSSSSSRDNPSAAKNANEQEDECFEHESDTEFVAQRLVLPWLMQLEEEEEDVDESNENVHDPNHHNNKQQTKWVDALAQRFATMLVHTEFAFCVLLQLSPSQPPYVYYGRDPWGRRSLLVYEPTTNERRQDWQLASVVATHPTHHTLRSNRNRNRSTLANGVWKEVPPGRIYGYNLRTGVTTVSQQSFALCTASSLLPSFPSSSSSMIDGKSSSRCNNNNNHNNKEALLEWASHQLEQVLLESVRRRIILHHHASSLSSSSFSHKQSEEEDKEKGSNRPGISILFSGGVDSTVLAALCLQALTLPDDSLDSDPTTKNRATIATPPLYLVNIEFRDDNDENENSPTVMAADTQSAHHAYQDLLRLFPSHHHHHRIHLISERVHWTEIQAHAAHIGALIAPKQYNTSITSNTHGTSNASVGVMDFNIAAALWFAARACPTRIVMTGLGADELMGGYTRHRSAWRKDPSTWRRNALHMDVERLWERNVGRDDRILSDHGKEARFPYLDAHVVRLFTSCSCSSSSNSYSLPDEAICDYTLPPGQGDKRILRLVAARLGFSASAAFAVKRAIQFGSRMSHVADKHRFGSRRNATKNKSL